MNTNLQSRCVVRNSNKNKLIWCNLVPCLKKQGNITTNFDAINILAKQCIEAVARRCPVKKVSLGAVHMEIVFLLLSRLPGKKILFPRVHIRNISPPGRDLFWQAVRWENFERSQYSKWVTQTWRKMASNTVLLYLKILVFDSDFMFGGSSMSIRYSKPT